MLASSVQSTFRTHVLAANPATMAAPQIASAVLENPIRSTASSTASSTARTTAAANPASGRYNNRSAIIVPIGNNRFDAGNKLRKANPAKKNPSRSRFHRIPASPTAPPTASQPTQSSTLPRTSVISEYE